MQIITLTTDFGYKDPYVAAVKGAILSQLEQVNIVDISHEVEAFHLAEAAYIIKNAYHTFPKNSIHIIGVDSELTPENKHIVAYIDQQYFICADNGIMSLLFLDKKPDKLVEINIHDRVPTDFPVLDAFINVACHIARGGTLEVIGKSIESIKELTGIRPVTNNETNKILGNVLYVDNYGNVITNISKSLFEEFGNGHKFEIQARSAKFDKIHKTYSDVVNFKSDPSTRTDGGKRLALWNSYDLLELAIYKSNPKSVGGAKQLLGLEYLDSISVTFNKD